MLKMIDETLLSAKPDIISNMEQEISNFQATAPVNMDCLQLLKPCIMLSWLVFYKNIYMH
jgi:hypothetical protein